MNSQGTGDQDREGVRPDHGNATPDDGQDWFWAQRHPDQAAEQESSATDGRSGPSGTATPSGSSAPETASGYRPEPERGYWSGPHDAHPASAEPPYPGAGEGWSGGYAAGSQTAYSAGYPTGTATQTLPASGRTTRRGRGRAGLLVVAMAFAALVGAGAGVGSYAYVADRNGTTAGGTPISTSSSTAPQAPTLNGTIEAAAAKIQPSVVTITVQAGNSGDIGSGVVLNKQGYILTNNHVVSAQSAQGYGRTSGSTDAKITVTFNNGKTASATVVGTAETEDLAVIKVNGVTDLTPATFADSGTLKVGQSVIAAGAPLGLSETITSGIVSSTARPVRSGDNNDAVYLAVQTDAAINPGNSGGALVDLNGAVVGINSSIASTGSDSADGSQSGNIGIGFAIPSDVATRVAQQLIDTGKATDAALGVTVSGTQDSSLGTTSTGVPLATVAAGGAAAKAGLRAGDVVRKINDFETTTADGLIAATRYYAPGTKVTVDYTRGGQTMTAQVTLGSL